MKAPKSHSCPGAAPLISLLQIDRPLSREWWQARPQRLAWH